MTLRFGLFGKIFLGFWLATIAVLASWMLSNHYFDTAPERGEFDHRPKGPPPRFVLRTIYELQNLDQAGVIALLEGAQAEHRVDIYLLDAQGSDLLGRPVPAQVSKIAQQLRGPRRHAFLKAGRERLLAQAIYRDDSGLQKAVFVFRPRGTGLIGTLGGNLWLRIGLAVLVSGLVCYLLSRRLTRPIRKLQAASRRLAQGELDTRLQVRLRGGDESDELARDFNSMAGQLQERVQAQKRLLGDVSHELRSPLARLRIALALAQDHPARSGEYLARIEQEAERLEALIDQLLDSQRSGGELASDVDLVALLEQLCGDANFEGSGQGKQVSLHTDIPKACVAGSADELRKCFDNVLRNALRHTPANTGIRVQLEAAPASYRVRICDRGPGVPTAELERIFEAFYRTDTARSRDSGGHGLGLAIARRVVQRHGGSISADNLDDGLAVTIILPRHFG